MWHLEIDAVQIIAGIILLLVFAYIAFKATDDDNDSGIMET